MMMMKELSLVVAGIVGLVGTRGVAGFHSSNVVSQSTLTTRCRPALFAEYVESKQAEYGKTIDLPSTYARCGRCQTSYALAESDLGDTGRGIRLECSVCGNTWFQSRDRLLSLSDDYEMVELPQMDLDRIKLNIEEGRSPRYVGEAKLYVGNLPFTIQSEEELAEMFSSVGAVGDIALARGDNGKSRGFAFVTMRTEDDGKKAIETFDGYELAGRIISVRESNN